MDGEEHGFMMSVGRGLVLKKILERNKTSTGMESNDTHVPIASSIIARNVTIL
jgi:hypothetical protein